ncbi:MAG: hypothetical protein ACI9I0_002553 [Rhodoferax sp.]|jgi:hypothetical protein
MMRRQRAPTSTLQASPQKKARASAAQEANPTRCKPRNRAQALPQASKAGKGQGIVGSHLIQGDRLCRQPGDMDCRATLAETSTRSSLRGAST